MPSAATYQLRDEAGRRFTALGEATTEATGADAALATARAHLARLEAERSPGAIRYRDVVARLEKAAGAAGAAREQALDALRRGTADLIAAGAPEELVELLERSAPVLLAPVRLETRFDGPELLVRVYPEPWHEDGHARALSNHEAAWGERYWQRAWRAGDDLAELRAAWQELAARFGPRRAAWVRRVLTPLNLGDAPEHPIRPPADAPIDPRFPDVARRPGGWPPAARARLLPDRWAALWWRQGQRNGPVWSAPVDPDLATTPDVEQALAGTGAALDAGMHWMVDFAEAEARGMGLRLPVGGGSRAVERVLVLGVRASLDSELAARALAEQLDAHRYTHGLDLDLPGAPTNNADERSAHSASDGSREQALADVRADGLPSPPRGGDADRLAGALGIGPATLGGLGAQAGDDQVAAWVQTVLWPVTWGYFLEQMTSWPPPAWLAEVRRHWIDWVRGGGPFPTVRVANQPYGVLPVLVLDRWVALDEAREHADVVALLRDARPLWDAGADLVPRAGAGDPEQTLLDLLAHEPTSGTVSARPVLGRELLRNSIHWGGMTPPDWNAAEAAATAALRRLGRSWTPRIARALVAFTATRLAGVLVERGGVRPQRPTGPGGYLALIDRTGLKDLRLQHVPGFSGDDGVPLLYLLVRHAALREVARAAVAALGRADQFAADPHEPEAVRIAKGQPPETVWEMLDSSAFFVTGGFGPVGEWLWATRRHGDLPEFSTALRALIGIDAGRLERGLREGLDAAAHRLDAWITGYAARRVAAMRRRRQTGLHLGAYGWVEHVERRRLTPAPPPPGESGPLWESVADGGWMHAPSLPQAVSAAMLRSAQLAHAPAAAGAAALLDLDLSSRRVRAAQRLLDGVRQGQAPGALLGYRIERRLRDSGQGALIAPLRRVAPFVAGSVTPSDGAAVEAVAAAGVADGLRLLRRWRSDPAGLVAADPDLPALGSAEGAALAAALDAVADELDAASDALVAEAVHQAAQGNHTRAGAALNADTPPPELHFLETPRSGLALMHRLLVVLDAAPPAAAEWASVPTTPRAEAHPQLEAWARALLPSPQRVRVRVRPIGGGASADVRLDRLGMGALDLLAAPPAPRLALAARAVLGLTADVELDDERDAAWDSDDLSVVELGAALGPARALVHEARALRPDDVTEPGAPAEADYDLAEASGRLATAAARLERALQDLAGPPDGPALAAALLELDGFGIPESVPVVPGDHADAQRRLAEQARGPAATGKERLAAYAAAGGQLSPQTLERRAAALFGAGGPPLLIGFRLRAPEALAASLSDGPAAKAPGAAADWLAASAAVRAGAGRAHAALTAVALLTPATAAVPIAIRVAQLPHRPGERWSALPDVPRDPSASVSLVMLGLGALDPAATICGLAVDQWTETLPAAEQTTGVAMHLQAPGACAPQALLLAVPATPPTSWAGPSAATAPGDNWTLAELEAIALEALRLAKCRMVDLDALSRHSDSAVASTGHLLSAAMLAHNPAGDTISSDPVQAAR